MPTRKLYIGLVAGALILLLGCGGRAPKVVFKQQAVLCPPQAVECDCEKGTDPREVGDLFGLQIQSLELYKVAKCLEDCEALNQKARELCEEQIEGLNNDE